MYICYVDESGNPDPAVYGGTPRFILLGLALPINIWNSLNFEVGKVSEKYGIQGAEIHFSPLNHFISVRPKDEKNPDRTTRRKLTEQWWHKSSKMREEKLEQYEPFFHLSADECKNLRQEITELLSNQGKLTIFAEIIDKDLVSERFPSQVVDLAFIHLMRKFDSFLLSKVSYGIVVQDATRPENHARLISIMSAYQDNTASLGLNLTGISRIVESPFFVDSKTHVGVQLADACCWWFKQYFTQREKVDPLFLSVFSRVYRQNGNLLGATHHVSNPNCKCKICQENRNQN